MAEEKDNEDLKGERLLKELGRVMVRLGREAVKADNEQKLNLTIASNMLNHAQGLAGIDDTRARRILGQVRRLITKG